MGVVMYALLANSLPFDHDEGWRRPADLSSRVWWRVSLEAKLLLQARASPKTQPTHHPPTHPPHKPGLTCAALPRALPSSQSLLEPQLQARGSLESFGLSAWSTMSFEQRREEPPMRHAFSFTDVSSSQLLQETQTRRVALPHAASWTELHQAPGVAAARQRQARLQLLPVRGGPGDPGWL